MRLPFRVQLLLVVGVGAAVIAVAAYGFDALRRLELSTIDTRFSVRGTQEHAGIATVGIDDKTIDEIKRERPAYRRSFHARVIDALRRDGARLVAYDVVFNRRTSPREDEALLAAAYRARPVVFAASAVSDRGETDIFGGTRTQRAVGARVGTVNFVPDPGGIWRRVPFAIEGLKSFAVVAAEAVDGRTLRPSDIGGDSALIDFAGPPGTIPETSFVDVLRGDFRPGTFRGKIVVVGASDPVLKDVQPTSTTHGELMSGPEIQANAIATVRARAPLREAGAPVGELLIVVLALVVPFAAVRMAALRAQVLALVVAAGYLGAAQLVFGQGIVLPVLYPLNGLVLGALGSLGVHYLLEAVERQRAHDTFARFVPEPVVDELLAQRGEDLRLPGVRVNATVLSSDIRGFTTFSETRDPEEIIDVLNRYFGEMTEAILDHGGTLINYVGDGIFAVFGAPLTQPDHGDRALACALEMLNVRLPRVNAWMRETDMGDGFRIGIGLHSGPLVAGNVGSMRHLQFSTIGDTCNTASRIEGLTKEVGYPLLISETTREILTTEPGGLQAFEEVAIRGRTGKLCLYGLPAG